jgi:hypothetical protein
LAPEASDLAKTGVHDSECLPTIGVQASGRIAVQGEIDSGWQPNATKIIMKDLATTWQEVDSAIQQFLVTELKIGMTFADSASLAESSRDRLYRRRLARRAYDNGLKWMRYAKFEEEDMKTYRSELRRLRHILNALGDPIEEPSYDELGSS